MIEKEEDFCYCRQVIAVYFTFVLAANTRPFSSSSQTSYVWLFPKWPSSQKFRTHKKISFHSHRRSVMSLLERFYLSFKLLGSWGNHQSKYWARAYPSGGQQAVQAIEDGETCSRKKTSQEEGWRKKTEINSLFKDLLLYIHTIYTIGMHYKVLLSFSCLILYQ